MDKDFKRAKKEILSVWGDYLYPDDIVEIFKEYKPKTYHDIKLMGFSLKKLGAGIYRTGYELKGYSIVVKIPIEETGISGIIHSEEEFRKLKLIQKKNKYKALTSFIPEILYFDKESGISLMPKYEKLKTAEGSIVSSVLSDVSNNLGRSSGGDLHNENIGKTDTGSYVIFDLGYF